MIVCSVSKVPERYFFFPENEYLVVEFDKRLVQGAHTIHLEFTGILNDELRGFYRSSYKDDNGDVHWLAVTQFESTGLLFLSLRLHSPAPFFLSSFSFLSATDARRAFPSFDEPSMKAEFNISLTIPEHMTALSNMPEQSSVLLGSGDDAEPLKTVTFQPSVLMSTYLVTITVTDYESVREQTASGVEVAVWTAAEKLDQADLALEVGVALLDFFAEIFNTPYPLPKLDMVAIPDFAGGGMEGFGILTYRDTALLWSNGSAAAAQRVVTVVAHEEAHLWFGDLVTMDWWHGLFLKEGFAANYEWIGADFAKPEWKVADQFVGKTQLAAMELDASPHSHPLFQEVHNPAQIDEIFDNISYDKGSSMIRMLNGIMGPGLFLEGIRLYLEEFQYGNARVEDLWASLQEAAENAELDLDIPELMHGWTRQMNYPAVMVRGVGGGKLELTQQRFVLNSESIERGEVASSSSSNVPPDYTWDIHISYAVGKASADPREVWLWRDEPSVEIDWDPETEGWIKLDSGEMGFYRVLYEAEQLALLQAALEDGDPGLSPSDRQGLLDDPFAFVEVGLMNASQALDLTRFLKDETSYPVWVVGLRRLTSWDTRLRLESEIYANWRTYLQGLLRAQVERLGWDRSEEESHSDLLLRPLLLEAAGRVGLDDVRAEARSRFQDFMESGGEEQMDENIAQVVYDIGIEEGGEKEFRFLYQRYLEKSSSHAAEAGRCLHALAQSREPWLLQTLLDAALGKGPEEPIRAQDTITVILHVAGNPTVGKYLAWNFVQRNWGTLFDRYGAKAFGFGNLIRGVIGVFDTELQYEEAKTFVELQREAGKLGTADRAADQALETVLANIRWQEENLEDIKDWLDVELSATSAPAAEMEL